MTHSLVRRLDAKVLLTITLAITWLGSNWCLAANSQVRIQAATAGINGNNRHQLIELRVTQDHTGWGPSEPGGSSRAELAFFDAAGTEFFTYAFPADAPFDLAGADDCGMGAVLVATPEYAQAFPATMVDFVLPKAQGATLSLLHSQAGSVCFRGTEAAGSESVNVCLTYGHPQTCSATGDCCLADDDCPEPGDTCSPADVEGGMIPFTASRFGALRGFNGTQDPSGAGCPAPPLALTGVTALAFDARHPENKDPCCAGETCHRNNHYALVDNYGWRNSLGQVVSHLPAADLEQGEALFVTSTFNGNLRTCHNCHLPEDGFGLRPQSIIQLRLNDPLNPLFAAENIPAIADLESPCLMHSGNRRALILENVLGTQHVFRNSMPLLNVAHTGPFGWSPCFGGSDNLEDFVALAVEQHTPRVLPRNVDPNNGDLLSNRNNTPEEAELMALFQRSLKTHVDDGLGALRSRLDGSCVGGANAGMTCGPCTGTPAVCPDDQCPGGFCDQGTVVENRTSNLDRLINAFVDFCPSADAQQIADGRQRFMDAGCINCHEGPFLGDVITEITGVPLHPGNDATGCPGECGTGNCALVSENDRCGSCGDECPGCDGEGCEAFDMMAFDIRPLVDAVRVKSGGPANPALGIFFHDGVARTVREAVEFYQSDANETPVLPSTPHQVSDIVAFLSAIVEVGDNGVCPPPKPVCGEVRRLRAECTDDGGVDILVVLENTIHHGRRVTAAVNGEPVTLGVIGRLATGEVCCPAGPLVVELVDPADCVESIELECTVPPDGACCLPDGGCAIGQESTCFAANGTWQGPEVTCSPNNCPQPVFGACCHPDGTCTFEPEFSCAGTYTGDDTTCEPNACPQPPSGACCLVDGTCQDVSVFGCPDLFLGDFTSCATDACPTPTGACCFLDGACEVLTEEECAVAEGNYSGHGTNCDPNLCDQPTGACCEPEGDCQVLTEDECVALPGTYQGDFVACEPDLCPLPGGACCFSDDTCIDNTFPECQAMFGTFAGNFTSCADDGCDPFAPPDCDDIRHFRMRCTDDGVAVLVALFDNSHHGQTVRVSVSGVERDVPIIGRIAQTTICCPTGGFDVELLLPSGCIEPALLICENVPH